MNSTSSTNPTNILIVDDTPANLKLLETMLSLKGYRVSPAINGQIALRAVKTAVHLPDLILLDISMPEMNGFEVCAKLKENPRTRKIPVIFISAISEESDKLKAFEMGGVDYIGKPFKEAEVLARIETHLALSRQQREIEEFNAQKDDLIRNVALNLKSPISNIMGYAELLLVEKEMMENVTQREQLLKGIFQGANQIHEMVNNLLEVTRMGDTPKMHMAAVLLRDVLEAQLDEQAAFANKQGVILERVPVEEYPTAMLVWADGQWLGRAFANVLNNAIKYTPTGGRVSLAVEMTAEEAIVTIRDTGMGIAETDQPYIFKPFYRSPRLENSALDGMGLGLPIALRILDYHHGRITFTSVPGRGTEFTVTLPLHQLAMGG